MNTKSPNPAAASINHSRIDPSSINRTFSLCSLSVRVKNKKGTSREGAEARSKENRQGAKIFWRVARDFSLAILAS
jgi:hypothetical protein